MGVIILGANTLYINFCLFKQIPMVSKIHLQMRNAKYATLKHSIPLVFRLRKVFDSRNILPQYFPITYTITAECTFKLPPNIKGCPHLQYENVVQFFFHSLTMAVSAGETSGADREGPCHSLPRVRHFPLLLPLPRGRHECKTVRSIAHGCKMKTQKHLLCHVINFHSLTLA